MRKCILTVGVSGSGKTTWAEQYVKDMAKVGEKWVNINRDDARAFFYTYTTRDQDGFSWGKWNWNWENSVTELVDDQINKAINDTSVVGVIISDTNINKNIRNNLFKRFVDSGFEVDIKLFDIAYEEAVKRDLKRKNPVGALVIAQQIDRYWEQFHEKYVPDPSLPKGVIVDVDGTIAQNNGNRSAFDWGRVHLDTPDELVIDVVRGLKKSGYHIVIVSGRDDVCQEQTWAWVCSNLGFEPSDMFMRKNKDSRKDFVVKREIFFNHIANKYNIVGVIDDRPQVIMECWKPIGLQVLMVGRKNPFVWF